MAEYFRRVLLSLDTDGIFYWVFRGHQWRSVQAQLLYNSTDASSFFFFFLITIVVVVIVVVIIIIITVVVVNIIIIFFSLI